MRKKNRLYTIFNSMHCRCERHQTHGYERYGGRGIKVCDEWRHFAPFKEWAMSNGYAEDLTLDRIDNDKGYSPDNCRWVTRDVQVNNQRTNHRITCNGLTLTLSQWERKTGFNRSTITNRIKSGMTPEEALHTPNRSAKRPLIATNPISGEILWFESTVAASKAGYSRPAIWRAINGEYKTHKGLIWKYA